MEGTIRKVLIVINHILMIGGLGLMLYWLIEPLGGTRSSTTLARIGTNEPIPMLSRDHPHPFGLCVPAVRCGKVSVVKVIVCLIGIRSVCLWR